MMGFFGKRPAATADDQRKHLLLSMDKVDKDCGAVGEKLSAGGGSGAGATAEQNEAFKNVLSSIEELNNGRVGMRESDLLFLKGLLESPGGTLARVYEDDEDDSGPPPSPEPVATDGQNIAADVDRRCDRSRNRDAQELSRILHNPLVRSLLSTHDLAAELKVKAAVAEEDDPAVPSTSASATAAERAASPVGNGHSPSEAAVAVKKPIDVEELKGLNTLLIDLNGLSPIDTIRVVGLRKVPGEPLGMTVYVENYDMVVARILGGSVVERQGLIHVGDIIKEVNGVRVRSPEHLQDEIAMATDSVTLKIVPTAVDPQPNATCHVRALFDYDPKDDKLLPCEEIGLEFQSGDILQVLDQTDPNWWQARLLGATGSCGLIPSQELEERRKAFVAPEADHVHKIGICGTRVSRRKKKTFYAAKTNAEFDRQELHLYEEVTRMPPFKRKTLVLVGTPGVGRRTLKNRLIGSDPERYGTTVPHTSRPMRDGEVDGNGYRFVGYKEMETDIRENRYLEYGEHGGHLYGTKMDSIRDVVRSGRMCVLDCSAAAMKILYNSAEFLPFVVFLASPGLKSVAQQYEMASTRYGGGGGAGKSLTFDRLNPIRYSSRRARTLESLAALYEEEGVKGKCEDNAKLLRTYEKYFDMVIVNDDFETTFKNVQTALSALSTDHQWVPVSWVY